jgi:hypothetical protein
MKTKISPFFFIPIIFVFFIASCTPALTNVWKDEKYQGEPFKKVFVLVALTDPTMKRSLEDEFVSQLAAHKTGSVASYTFFLNVFITDKEYITSNLKELKPEAFLIMRLIKIRKEETYIPEKNYVIPSWYYDWYSYYSTGLQYIQSPKDNDENYFIIMETNMYEAKNEKLIWFARSDLLPFTCGCLEIKSFIKVIIEKLSSQQLIRSS